LKFVVEQ